jgi:hypothetical protein
LIFFSLHCSLFVLRLPLFAHASIITIYPTIEREQERKGGELISSLEQEAMVGNAGAKGQFHGAPFG